MNYPHRWEQLWGSRAGNWGFKERNQFFTEPDRAWLYENVETPILDVGCGTGVESLGFEDYVGVDITPSFLKTARKYDVDVVRCDGRYLPFRDKSFKTCYSKELLPHYQFEDALVFIKEMIRVADKVYSVWGKGYVPSTNPKSEVKQGFHYNRFDIRELRKYCDIEFIKNGTTTTLISPKGVGS